MRGTVTKMPLSAQRELAGLMDAHNQAAVVSLWNPQTIAAWKSRHRGQFSLAESTSQWRGVRLVQGRGWVVRVARQDVGYCRSEADAAQLYNLAAYGTYGDNYQPNEASDV